MAVTASLQRFVEDELSRAAALAETTADLTLAQLQQPREGMLSQAEREQHHELVQALPRHKPAFAQAFAEALRTGVLADLHGTEAASAPVPAKRGLELMDETRVEADIEISGAAQLIAGSADWELRELQTFVSTLAGHQHVVAETNPLRPLAYARALWTATGAVTESAALRGLLLRTAAGVMSGQLKHAWAAACTRLEAQGVEPSVYRTVVLAPGPQVERELTLDVTRPGALEGLLASMPGAAADAPVPRARTVDGPNPAFEDALTRLEALLQRASATPGAGPAPAPQLRQHRDALMASTAETVDRQVVELLSRLFEAVLSDPRLPPAFRTVMARLQVSALRVALADATMLAQHDHPVWRLLNRIGSVAETYTQTTDPRWATLLAFCDTLAEELARAPVQDALLYRQSLARLDAFLHEQLREQQRRAQPAIDALGGMEQREALERQLSHMLTEQMAAIRSTPGVRRFVTGTWARVLAHTMHAHGEKAEPTLAYLRATDDLLWSLRLPDHPQSRKRLLAMLPGLLQQLRDGMTLIGLPSGEQQPILDELMSVHTEALRPGKTAAPAEGELTPHEIVQRMRDETAWEAPSRPPFSDSLVDLSSMETVPAEILPAAAGSRDDPASSVDALLPGDRQHLFLQGRWTRVQLLWRSVRGEYFLFAGTDPAHPHSITRRALERLCAEGLMKPLDDVSLVQRAVDALMRKLTLPA
ncbi:MAG TPA: DUF1631 family protein [Albitalea sp.]|uniref:DUF1631 family protein n=1 Tax=Piscinibacter sp. TaxID=1903157 RepID=UPI002ED0A235